MIKKGFVIDTQRHTIDREIEYDDTRVDGLWYREQGKSSKEGANLIPIAFVFPIEHKESVQILLGMLAHAKKAYDDAVAKIYYKEFPKYRS